MCQAFADESRFVIWMERKNGRCANGHLRYADGLCMQGKPCRTNDAYFEAARIRAGGKGGNDETN